MDIKYLTDSYEEGIERLKMLDAPLNFVFITDPHHRMPVYKSCGYNKMSYEDVSALGVVQSIEYILQRVPNIQCIVNGGDIGNDYDPDPDGYRRSMHEYMDALYALSRPVHSCIGNHDDRVGRCLQFGWDIDQAMFPGEMHELCMKYNPTEENYYYVDINTSQCGYRFVMLNTSDLMYAYDKTGNFIDEEHTEISARQARWYEKEALNTDRKILVFSHDPIHQAGIIGIGPTGDLYDGVSRAPWIYYHSKNCENVVAMIAGHVHYDNVVLDEELPTITSAACTMLRWHENLPQREPGTPSEGAFDVMSIKGDRLYITRFGAGEHREVTLPRMHFPGSDNPYIK